VTCDAVEVLLAFILGAWVTFGLFLILEEIVKHL